MKTYQVEYFDRESETERLVPYGTNKPAAQAYARRMSDKHDTQAYVVYLSDDEPVGHVSYVFGMASEKEGDTK